MVMLALSASALVVLPLLQVRHVEPLPGLKPYTSTELRGREVYVANGCIYCHTQQPPPSPSRPTSAAAGAAPPWPATMPTTSRTCWAPCAPAPT